MKLMWWLFFLIWGFRQIGDWQSRLPGIDVLGGHTHHVLEEPLVIGQTVLGAAGKFGQWLGKVVLERTSVGEPLQLVSSGCMVAKSILLDDQVTLAIATNRTEAERTLNQTAVITDRVLSITYDRESPFATLLAQAVRHFTGAQLSLVNAGQLLGDLPQGNITKGMLHSLCPSPINACTICLSGSHIREALEQSLLDEFSGKPIMGFGFRGHILGTYVWTEWKFNTIQMRQPMRRSDHIHQWGAYGRTM